MPSFRAMISRLFWVWQQRVIHGVRGAARAGADRRHHFFVTSNRYRQWRQPRRPRGRRQSLSDAGAGGGRRRQDLARLSVDPGRRRPAGRECPRPHRQGPVAECQGRRHRQGCRRTARRQQHLTKQTALSEKGEVINGRGDKPNRHDVLTGSQPDGTAFAAGEDRTCKNWTSSTQGSAMLGHPDRIGPAR